MEQFDREDSSNYAEPSRPVATEPVKEEVPVQPPAQQFPKQKKSKAPLILMLLLLLSLAAATVFGWMWYQQSGELDSVRTDLSSQRNKVAQLESAAKAEAALEDEDAVSTDTKDAGSATIVETALAYENAQLKPLTGVKAEIAYNKGDFAKVNITSSTTGYYQVLKRTNEIWVVIGSGNGELSQETIDRYGIPAEALK